MTKRNCITCGYDDEEFYCANPVYCGEIKSLRDMQMNVRIGEWVSKYALHGFEGMDDITEECPGWIAKGEQQ